MKKSEMFKDVPNGPAWLRWVLFLLGLWIMTIGISMSVKAGLGTSPISAVPAVLMSVVPLSFGVITILMNWVFVLIQIVVLRKEFTRVNYLQFLVAVVFGQLNDLSLKMLGFINPANYVMQWVFIILGALIVGLGVFIQTLPKLIYVPGEGIVAALTWKSGWRFGTVKQCLDWTLVLIAVCCSLVFLHGLEGVREGTVFAAFAVGGFIKVYARIWNRLVGA